MHLSLKQSLPLHCGTPGYSKANKIRQLKSSKADTSDTMSKGTELPGESKTEVSGIGPKNTGKAHVGVAGGRWEKKCKHHIEGAEERQ